MAAGVSVFLLQTMAPFVFRAAGFMFRVGERLGGGVKCSPQEKYAQMQGFFRALKQEVGVCEMPGNQRYPVPAKLFIETPVFEGSCELVELHAGTGISLSLPEAAYIFS